MPWRLPKYPDIPTWGELGYYQFPKGSFTIGIGIVGPKGIPKEIVNNLHNAFKQAMDDTKFRETMDNLDMPTQYQGPEEFAKSIEKFNDLMGNLLPQVGLK
jgi:tripartite-type tricarboxylate transporter receptor subunit TctC